MSIHTRPWLPGHFHWRWRKAQAVKSQLTQYFIKIKAKVTLDKNPRNNEAYERKAQQNERTDLSLESFEILCTWNTQKISFTGNTERSLSAPDTHFHQKLQLKHQTTDIHAHVNRICCSFTIITLLCYVMTLFTSLLIDTVNIVLSLLDFTQLVKLWFLRLITYYIAVHIYHQQQGWHLFKCHKQSIIVPRN